MSYTIDEDVKENTVLLLAIIPSDEEIALKVLEMVADNFGQAKEILESWGGARLTPFTIERRFAELELPAGILADVATTLVKAGLLVRDAPDDDLYFITRQGLRVVAGQRPLWLGTPQVYDRMLNEARNALQSFPELPMFKALADKWGKDRYYDFVGDLRKAIDGECCSKLVFNPPAA